MYVYNETLSTPEANLAFDEALVDVADQISLNVASRDNSAIGIGGSNEVLRLWELDTPCVVLGRASKWEEEVDSLACQRDGIPILRRVSGGASIVAGPGCLMYSVLISYQHRPAWRSLDVAHREVMCRIRDAVQQATDSFQMSIKIAVDGTCDLTIDNRKFSGNALRCKRYWMLYHGTIMYSMPVEWLTNYLREPSRQPVYRGKRDHDSFVMNVLDASDCFSTIDFRRSLECHLANTWEATQSWQSYPWKSIVEEEAARLHENRYSKEQWRHCR